MGIAADPCRVLAACTLISGKRKATLFCAGRHTAGLNPSRALTDMQAYTTWRTAPARQLLDAQAVLPDKLSKPACFGVSPKLVALSQSGAGGREMLSVWRT